MEEGIGQSSGSFFLYIYLGSVRKSGCEPLTGIMTNLGAADFLRIIGYLPKYYWILCLLLLLA